MLVLFGTKCIWKKKRILSKIKVVCNTKRTFTLMHMFECSQKSSDNLPAPTLHPAYHHWTVLFSLSGWSAITSMKKTWRSLPDHRSCRSECQNTSVILPRRWSSYVIWFVLHIRIEAWVAQVISYGGIDEGNSNTSCSVWIVGRNGRMGMVSLTNNFKFCRLNWK